MNMKDRDYKLKLFIVGSSKKADRLLADLRQLCDEELGSYELDVIDVLANPEIAASEHVMATPTLIRETPGPAKRIVGDLSDRKSLMLVLDEA